MDFSYWKDVTKAIIDADQIIYATAVMAEGSDEPDSHILHTTKKMLEKRVREVKELYPNIQSVLIVVSDKENFRKKLAKERKYKGNRPPKPLAYNLVRDYIIKHHGGIFRPYLEADDVTCMIHNLCNDRGVWNSVLVDQDKDLDQVAGHRVVPSLKRNGKVVREARAMFITPEEASYSFYKQLLTGDAVDAIGGLPGYGPKKAEKVLEEVKGNPYEMWLMVAKEYHTVYDKDEMDEPASSDIYSLLFERAQLLYMRRYPNDCWIPPRKFAINVKEDL